MKKLSYLLVILCLISSSCQGIKYEDKKKGQGFTLTNVPQFEAVDIDIKVSGAYLNACAVRGPNNVLYLLLNHGSESYSFTLLNAEGKPKIYDDSMVINLVVSSRGFTLKLGDNDYYHGMVILDKGTRVQYVILNQEKRSYSFPLLDSNGIPILFEGGL